MHSIRAFPINDKKSSPAGNRTPVSRVTGGDTNHYTTEDLLDEEKMYLYRTYVYKPSYFEFYLFCYCIIITMKTDI